MGRRGLLLGILLVILLVPIAFSNSAFAAKIPGDLDLKFTGDNFSSIQATNFKGVVINTFNLVNDQDIIRVTPVPPGGDNFKGPKLVFTIYDFPLLISPIDLLELNLNCADIEVGH